MTTGISSPTSLSFQLPDLLSQINSFTFRTNKHIRRATDCSEDWILGLPSSTEPHSPSLQLTDDEKELLPKGRYGLLAGLACPTCDFPQLLLLTDFLSLAFIAHNRVLEGRAPDEWLQKASSMTKVKDGGDPFEILDIHPLFTSIVPRLKRNLGLLPPSQQTLWVKKFARSVHAFVAAQSQIRDNLRENRVPSLQEYLISRREAYASSMFWDLVELLDISPRPNGRNPNEHLKLKRLTQCAVDAVAWAIDVFAYAAPSRCNTYNLISLLTSHKNLSVQGAMNYAGGMVRETLEEFHRLERELVPLTKPDSDGPSSHSHPPATTTSSSTVSPSPSSSGSSNNSRRSSGWGRWLWSIPASLVGDTGTSTSSSSSTAKPTSTGRPYLLGIDPSSRDGWFLGFDTDSSLNSTATTPISDDDGSSSTFDNASLNHSSSSSLDHSSSSSSDHTSPSLPSPTSPTPFDNPDTDLLTTTKNLSRYILSLKDYIVGSIHWGYETELYFGTKGDEIRSFGWVFLS